MKKRIVLCLVGAYLLSMSTEVSASVPMAGIYSVDQTNQQLIKGTVSDANGPLIGATVVILNLLANQEIFL